MKNSIQIMLFISTLTMVAAQPAFAVERQQEGSWYDAPLKAVKDFVKDAYKTYKGVKKMATDLGKKSADNLGQAADRAGKEISGASTLVTGTMVIDIKAGDVTSLASGNNSASDIKIGTIGGSMLKDVMIDVDVKDVTSVASGEKSQSFVKIGSIEKSKVDEVASIKVKANEVASIASGQQSSSSVALGSVY